MDFFLGVQLHFTINHQFLTRLYKEYDPVKIPGSLLVRLQFDLVMRKWIVLQEIQQFPLQILLT